MFSDRYLEKYADVMLWGLKTARTRRFKKGDNVLLKYHIAALPLAEIIYARILEMGVNPIQRVMLTPNMERSFYELSDNRQLVFCEPGEQDFAGELNGLIVLHAPESITHLGGVDPVKIGKAAIARKPLREIMEQRENSGDFSWTLCMYPTAELAKHAKLSVKEYADQITKACFLNKQFPVAEWERVFNEAMVIKKWLNAMKVVSYHLESAGCDLIVTPGARRKWIGISGHNMPSFELFLSPDWRGTKGVYFADQPSFRSGNYVEGVRLEFKKGSAVGVTATQGEQFVQKQLTMDKGANKLGEFSLTDKRFSKISKFMANTLFDENFGGKQGNCHVAVGASYSDTFAGNPAKLTKELKVELGFNDSALHWDLVNTEKKRVTANLKGGGKVVIYENGMFKY